MHNARALTLIYRSKRGTEFCTVIIAIFSLIHGLTLIWAFLFRMATSYPGVFLPDALEGRNGQFALDSVGVVEGAAFFHAWPRGLVPRIDQL